MQTINTVAVHCDRGQQEGLGKQKVNIWQIPGVFFDLECILQKMDVWQLLV